MSSRTPGRHSQTCLFTALWEDSIFLGVTEKIIPDTIGDLKGFDLKLLAPGHCTGWRALTAMARIFGDELIPSAVGKRYVI